MNNCTNCYRSEDEVEESNDYLCQTIHGDFYCYDCRYEQGLPDNLFD